MKTQIEFTRTRIIPPLQDRSSNEIGACLEFSGIVRERENGKKIPGLFYEAYEPMARTRIGENFPTSSRPNIRARKFCSFTGWILCPWEKLPCSSAFCRGTGKRRWG